jgi:hypothetical protein
MLNNESLPYLGENCINLLEPLVYIVIVNYYGHELLRRCLQSLRKTKYGNYRVLVVDNGSKDGSVKMVREIFPEVEIIALPKNLGYAKANNIGIVHALKHGAEYIVLLNNDTEILDPLWLHLAVKIMEKYKDIGILGFNLILPNGKLQQYSDKTKPWEVGEVSFAATVIRAQVFHKIGYLDPEYVIGYAEDTDFCYRARRCGFKITYVPQIKVFHISQATFKRVSHLALIISARNGFRHFLLNKPLYEAFIWLTKTFVDVKDGKIVLRNDIRRLRMFTYGFITYIKHHGSKGFFLLLAESFKRRLSQCH